MKYLGRITNLKRASQPEFIRIDGSGAAGGRAIEQAAAGKSYKVYSGEPLEDQDGNELPGVIALNAEGAYIDVLAVDGKSLQTGGFVSVSIQGITYHFNYREIHG